LVSRIGKPVSGLAG